MTAAPARAIAGAVLLALCLVVIALLTRPLLPVDETRYLTVAWEMFRSGDLLVPHLNGELYSHKPPLLFWLINAAWSVTGPSEFVGRLVPALFLPVSVLLTGLLGRRIGGEALGGKAAFVAAGMTALTLLGSLAMFDAMLTAAAATALIGLADAAKGRLWRGFALAGLAMGAGLLIKGPAILLHVLPAALLAPLWAPRPQKWGRWYALVAAATAIGAAIVLAWALPAAQAGGPAFGRMLLWGQTAGRVASAKADHARPIWTYGLYLPLLLAPWVLSRSVWAGLLRREAPPLHRLPWVAGVSSLVLFTLISAKQPHYLLPALPSFALIIAGLLDRAPKKEPFFALALAILGAALVVFAFVPAWSPRGTDFSQPLPGLILLAAAGVAFMLRREPLLAGCLASSAVFVSFHLAGALGGFGPQDLSWAGARLQAAPSAPVAFVGEYQGELGFKGRLNHPVQSLTAAQAPAWLTAHPDGLLFVPYRKTPPAPLTAPVEARAYRGGHLGLWRQSRP